jgi:hypothetical protein
MCVSVASLSYTGLTAGGYCIGVKVLLDAPRSNLGPFRGGGGVSGYRKGRASATDQL